MGVRGAMFFTYGGAVFTNEVRDLRKVWECLRVTKIKTEISRFTKLIG